ncbi:MAG: hypothetical protein V4487_00340 [Chlamydiota bacterium]
MAPITKVRPCERYLTCDNLYNPKMFHLIDSIKGTTPEQFDILCKDLKNDFDPLYICNILDAAFTTNNQELVNHILKNYPHALNYGNQLGQTPVVRFTLMSESRTDRMEIIIGRKSILNLIQLNADLNFSTLQVPGRWTPLQMGSTALFLAAKKGFTPLVELLVDFEAAVGSLPLDAASQKLIDCALKTKQVASQKFLQELFPIFLESTPLPMELVTLIAQYSYIGQTERDLSAQS